MSDPLSYAELDGQRVELLPARTVLSMFVLANDGAGANGTESMGLLGVGIPIVGHYLPNLSDAQGGDGKTGAVI